MQTKIEKWGNNLAILIPKSFAMETDLKQNELVEVAVDDAKIIITPMKEKKYSLEDLLKGVSKNNLHEEVDTGSPVGKEIW
jgi:antitoxin MazE